MALPVGHIGWSASYANVNPFLAIADARKASFASSKPVIAGECCQCGAFWVTALPPKSWKWSGGGWLCDTCEAE